MAKPKHVNGEYVRLNEISDMLNEANDCSVISLAAALDITYKKAHEHFEIAGRKKGRGVSTNTTMKALWNSGVKFRTHSSRNIMRESNYKYSKTLTFNNCVKILDKSKKYIIIGREHMAALKYGQVVDWSEGRKIFVEDVVEITT